MQRSIVVLGLFVVVGLLGSAQPARACLWVGAGSPSSIGKVVEAPRTEAERKHQGAHGDALSSRVDALARHHASFVEPRRPAPYSPETKNH